MSYGKTMGRLRFPILSNYSSRGHARWVDAKSTWVFLIIYWIFCPFPEPFLNEKTLEALSLLLCYCRGFHRSQSYNLLRNFRLCSGELPYFERAFFWEHTETGKEWQYAKKKTALSNLLLSGQTLPVLPERQTPFTLLYTSYSWNPRNPWQLPQKRAGYEIWNPSVWLFRQKWCKCCSMTSYHGKCA